MKNTTNKIFFILLCLTLCISFTLNAAADVIWEPRDNSFYEQHSGEFDVQERSYTANSEISVFKAPGDSKADGKIAADSQFVIGIHWTADDGTVWGYVQTGDELGWAKLSEMTVVYDYISFKDEHKNEIATCNEKFSLSTEFEIYAYPGSGTVLENLSDRDIPDNEEISASEKYTAPDGREWYFCSYLYGTKNFWFTQAAAVSGADVTTADSVTNDSTTVASATVDSTKTDSAGIDSSANVPTTVTPPEEKETDMKTTALVLVVLLAVATAILIPVIMKRKKK